MNKSDRAFLKRALASSKETREYLQEIQYLPGYAFACDGARVHMILGDYEGEAEKDIPLSHVEAVKGLMQDCYHGKASGRISSFHFKQIARQAKAFDADTMTLSFNGSMQAVARAEVGTMRASIEHGQDWPHGKRSVNQPVVYKHLGDAALFHVDPNLLHKALIAAEDTVDWYVSDCERLLLLVGGNRVVLLAAMRAPKDSPDWLQKIYDELTAARWGAPVQTGS